MNDRETALALTLEQIKRADFSSPEPKRDLATDLVLYLIGRHAELLDALKRAVDLIEEAEKESNWTTCQGLDGDSATVELRAIIDAHDHDKAKEWQAGEEPF